MIYLCTRNTSIFFTLLFTEPGNNHKCSTNNLYITEWISCHSSLHKFKLVCVCCFFSIPFIIISFETGRFLGLVQTGELRQLLFAQSDVSLGETASKWRTRARNLRTPKVLLTLYPAKSAWLKVAPVGGTIRSHPTVSSLRVSSFPLTTSFLLISSNLNFSSLSPRVCVCA